MAKKEPQSYGSQPEWVKGETGQNVNKQKSEPTGKQEEFYDNRRESETSEPHQGGDVSEVQLAENAEPVARATPADAQPVTSVTDTPGGAKRTGYFKNRDYK